MRLKHDAHGVFLPMYFCFMAVLLVKYKGCMPQKYCKCSTLPVELERVISVFQLILPECMKLLPLYTNCILKNDILLGGECNDVRYLFSNLLIHSQFFFNMAEDIAVKLQRSQSTMKITIVFIPSSSGTFTNNWMKTFYMLCVMKKTRLLLRLPVVPSKYIFFPPCLLSFAWEKLAVSFAVRCLVLTRVLSLIAYVAQLSSLRILQHFSLLQKKATFFLRETKLFVDFTHRFYFF